MYISKSSWFIRNYDPLAICRVRIENQRKSMAANPNPVEGSMPKTHLTPMSQSAPKPKPQPQPQPQGPPSVPTRPIRPIHPETNKRKLIGTTFSNPNSPYFKIRALTQQLRPHFIEVHYTTLHVKNIFFINICMHVFLFSWTMWVLFLVGLCCFFVGLKSSVQEKACLSSACFQKTSQVQAFIKGPTSNIIMCLFNMGFDLTIYNII